MPTYDAKVRFEVLGSLRLSTLVRTAPDASAAGPSLGGPKQRVVLALLLAEANTVVSIDRLVDGVWSGDPPESARHTIQSYIFELRKIPGSVIERLGSGYRIVVDGDSFDAIDFERRIAMAREIARSDLDAAAATWEAALGLWRGPAYADFDEPVLRAEATRLDELRLAAFEELMHARLRAGRHSDVVAVLDRATREHPYREELRVLHMLALYRSGRQADALRAYQITREILADDLGIAPSPRLRRLEEQILLQDPDLTPDDSSSASDATDSAPTNPYLGLRAFREADHGRFFGQDELVGRLIERVHGRARFSALVGPSGAGKSSVIYAGLIPRLRIDLPSLAIVAFQPGAQPFAAIESAVSLLHGGDGSLIGSSRRHAPRLRDVVDAVLDTGWGRLLIIVDQFEELFTQVDGVEAARFVAEVAALAEDADRAVDVVVVLRADFYDRPLADPRLGRLFVDNVVSIVSMGPDQLEAAATQPARQVDLALEPRLVGRLIADVAGQPNALPLFQYALTELFDARDGSVLDLHTYERIGGVRKAVARRAESVFNQLSELEQETARQMFLRIATVSGDYVGRRRVPASELLSLDVDVVALQTTIDVFSRYRLLALDRDHATGSPTVEVAHEALLTEWMRLRTWIEQHRHDLSKRAIFLTAINEWESAGRDPGYLLHGSRLVDYERWTAETGLRLTAAEHDYIAAAVAARDAAAADELDRELVRSKLHRRARRQRTLLLIAVTACIALIAYPLSRRNAGSPETIAVLLGTDRSSGTFENLLASGLESVAERHGLEAIVVEPPYTDVESEIGAVGDTEPAVVVSDTSMADYLLTIAPDHPDTTFAVIDLVDERAGAAPNVVAVRFAHEQGSFLIGAAAALETRTGQIGYIGANSQEFIESFRAGFEQGARASLADVVIEVDLIDRPTGPQPTEAGYDDPERAKEIATGMYERGVDVIFVAAGESGRGALEAATELGAPGRRLWVIGVDSDQFFDITDEQRDHLLTSMFKRLDRAIEAVVAADRAGGISERELTLTLSDGALGYTNTGHHLRPATIEAIETFRRGIVEGTIVVDPEPITDPPTARA